LRRQRGEGSFAIVYEATHPDFADPVAVKLWRAPLTPRQLARFRHECRLHETLVDSDRIVTLLRTHAIDGEAPWTVLALYDESLEERLGRPPALTPDQKFVLADDVLAALEDVHDAGYLHRDVKPENVLLRGDRAALSDLGMAMRLDDGTSDRAAGSAYYLAPELTGGATEPTVQSDIFSAAVTLRRLFGEDAQGALEQLLTRASSFMPTDRPRTVAEFRSKLAKASPPTARARNGRRRRLIVAIVASILVVAAVAGYVLRPDGPLRGEAEQTSLLFQDDFTGAQTWPTVVEPEGRSAYTSGEYDLRVTQDQTPLYLKAPSAARASRQSVEARGYLVDGQGGWGVWCRGAGPGEVYAFNLTHGGAAEIRTPTGTTGFRFVNGLDIYRPNRLRGDCTDLEVGGVDLLLSVNDVPVLHRTETTEPVLGPGPCGVQVWAFRGLEGELAHARITSFGVSRLD